MRVPRAPAVALAFAASLAVGAEPPPEPLEPPVSSTEEPWTLVTSRPVLLRTRARPGTRVREVWASAVVAAPSAVVQEVLLDGENHPRFMPYVQEVRMLHVPTTDGSWFAYQRVAPPIVAARDVVLHVFLEASVAPDGTGYFRNRWEAVPDMVPAVPGAVRTPISSGSWEVRPIKPDLCRATYRFVVDPGGNIPSWMADMGNRTGIPDLFKAVEKEAKRRAADPRRARRAPVAAVAEDAGAPGTPGATTATAGAPDASPALP